MKRILAAISLLVLTPPLAAVEPTPQSLGRAIFFDADLSASGRMSCATCHVPAAAHAQANALPVQLGGPELDVPGFRAVPSLRYLNLGLPFAFDDEGTPSGGFNRDGHAVSLMAQAARPFLGAHEMANGTPAAVIAKLRAAPYAPQFAAVFGATVFEDPDAAFLRVRFALQAFEQSAPEFHPFDSKYDGFLRGKWTLAPQELRGLALFNRGDKGNCAACHPSARGKDGSMPLFTDFTFDNLGVPRNDAIPANGDPAYFDLGLCPQERSELCGAFKVPTLRNVATRKAFFHNGRFASLADALRFYVRRDTHPHEFYPRDKFDDLPPALRGNVNVDEAPYDRRPGQAPRLSESEIADVIAFLQTLTDGYDPVSGTADPARNLFP